MVSFMNTLLKENYRNNFFYQQKQIY